ncbi:fibrillin-1-like isoform X2 [Actinia tenebrosa]|uniref:Fibrillin-1-like isoform X2 n=1 Tax=Actinia tenebrosa TaxID=6105 RepID=A0A6P8ISA4_ACTTE|nr:fibrillin-1-like isoform X2 [Actinia tenebrosa]
MNFQERCTLAALLLVLPGFCVLEDIRHLIWEQCTDDLFEPEVNGMVLRNHSFRLLKAELPILCLFVCKSNKDCVSFNIAPSNETEGWFSCELNQADRYSSPQDFQERKGFSYRGIKNPCLNNGLCEGNKTCTRLGYDLTKYTCLCPNGYFGQNCEKDIDECASSNLHNCTLENPGVKCNNTPGSFKCICAEGYVGDGINCAKKTSWIKINIAPMCIGVKNDDYGEVIVPFDNNVKQFKLVYLSGGVSQNNDPVTARYWGDNSLPQCLRFFITDEKNKIIAPYPGYPEGRSLYFTIDHITVSSPELMFPTSDPPLPLKKDDKLRVWFTFDLHNYKESYTYGKTCADLYIQ